MRTHRRRWFVIGGLAAVAAAFAAFVGTGVAASNAKPKNTSPPTISGTYEVGKTLAGDNGKWDNKPTDFNYWWMRCDKNGGSCANISDAHALKYTLTSADQGNTLRFKVEAVNSDGSTMATSVPTAVVAKASSSSGGNGGNGGSSGSSSGACKGNGTVNVKDISLPIRLLVDKWDFNPNVVNRSTQTIEARVHVADTCNHSVAGALVWATAIPYNQVSVEQATTGGDGYATLTFTVKSGFPANPGRQQIMAILVRATDPNGSALAGKSTRRALSLSVNAS